MSHAALEKSALVLISNSEVSTYLTCERKHYYNFGLRLTPNRTPTALYRGIVGHDALAAYYEVVRDGGSLATAQARALEVINTYAIDPFADFEVLNKVKDLVSTYFDYAEYEDKGWKILEVEKQYEIPIPIEAPEPFGYGMRLDLLVEVIDGSSRHYGEVQLVDHKFIYNFYTPDEIMMNVQFPKYRGALMVNGVQTKRGILNMIRHRGDAKQRFERTPVENTSNEIRQVMVEQVRVSERIMARRSMPIEEQSKTAIRVGNPYVCKMCPFRMACKTELGGQSAEIIFEMDFRKSTYGYVSQDEEL